MPKTTLGKWAVGLIIAMPILFFIGSSFTNILYVDVSSGETMLQDIVQRPALALTMLVGMASGFAAFITGIIAITKYNERNVPVYLATVIGALLILFLAGEIIFPH